MKSIAAALAALILATALPCLGQESGQTGIDWDKRTQIDPRTGDLIIDISERTPAERQPSPPPPPLPARTIKPILKHGEGRTYTGVQSGERIMTIGDGEAVNLDTGERILNMGGGEALNVTTGERILDIGDGEKVNVNTGERIIKDN